MNVPCCVPETPALAAGRDAVRVWNLVHGGHGAVVFRAAYDQAACDRHAHDTFLISLNVQGAHRAFYRGDHITVPHRGLVVYQPGEVHSCRRVSTEPWVVRGVYPSVELMRALAGTDHVPTFDQPVIRDEALADAFEAAHVAAARTGDFGPLAEVLSDVIAWYAGSAEDWDGVSATGIVARVREFIDAHYAERISLGDLAAVAGLSRFHFLRVFQEEVGIPPYAYLMDRRVRAAVQLLGDGVPIVEVAASTGFSDQSHLTRRFKRHLGMTPGQYQRGAVASK